MAEKKLYLADGFTEIGNRIGAFCMNNRAHILTGLGVAGTITTGVLSARSGAIAARKIDRKENELGRRLTAREKTALCGRHFIAPAIAGIFSISGTIGSDVINTKMIGIQNAALIASEKAYEQLSRKTREVLGDKKAKQVQDEIAKENTRESGVVNPINLDNAPRSGNGPFYPYVDDWSHLLFWSNPDYIKCVVKTLNEMRTDLPKRGSEFDYSGKEIGVPYSEWLKSLNFDPNVYNANMFKHLGWNKGYNEDDDDPIGYSTAPETYSEGFAVTTIRWEKDPSDMRLGRLLKSNGL